MSSFRLGVPALLLGVSLLVSGVAAAPAAMAAPGTPSVGSEKQPKAPTANELTKDPASLLVLVNRDNALKPANYKPKDLRTVAGSDSQLRDEAATALESLLDAARKDSLSPTVLSAYRSYDRQAALFNQYKARYGVEFATRISAPAGTSEHQLGLATDLGSRNTACDLKACFGDTPEGKWLAKNVERFGFIVRYPADGEKITGYKHEPWHLRYIGVDQALAMKAAKATTFEEYHASLVKATKVKPLTAEEMKQQRESLLILRFLPPYRDWSIGYDFAR